jgi:hypothetical protein
LSAGIMDAADKPRCVGGGEQLSTHNLFNYPVVANRKIPNALRDCKNRLNYRE